MTQLRQLFIFLALFLFCACSNTTRKKEVPAAPIPGATTETVIETPADRFNTALLALYDSFHYKAQDTTASKRYIDGLGNLAAWQALFERCLDSSNLEHVQALEGFSNIQRVKQTLVKSEETLDGLYLKVHIEEWTFINSLSAEKFASELLHYDLDRECVSKGGFVWWRIDDKFYLFQSDVYRFAFEFDKMRDVMMKALTDADNP